MMIRYSRFEYFHFHAVSSLIYCFWLICLRTLERHACSTLNYIPAIIHITFTIISWHAMLKMTHQKLELMTDIDMFQFLEKGMCVVVFHILPTDMGKLIYS